MFPVQRDTLIILFYIFQLITWEESTTNSYTLTRLWTKSHWLIRSILWTFSFNDYNLEQLRTSVCIVCSDDINTCTLPWNNSFIKYIIITYLPSVLMVDKHFCFTVYRCHPPYTLVTDRPDANQSTHELHGDTQHNKNITSENKYVHLYYFNGKYVNKVPHSTPIVF